MIGATMIETADQSPISVRSAFELLSSACAIHPGFADARILELSAGVRPAFPSNIPSITASGRHLIVNGTYRHGFLLAPVLAEILADFLETGATFPGIVKPR